MARLTDTQAKVLEVMAQIKRSAEVRKPAGPDRERLATVFPDGQYVGGIPVRGCSVKTFESLAKLGMVRRVNEGFVSQF